MFDDLRDAFGSEVYDVDCIYSFCEVSCKTREGLLRHLMDRHGHSYVSAQQSLEEG